ncbi:MAG: chemotaxis protein CheD [Gemmatimonadota bacterium]|nr:chemotaxis protein CheD [Gemmatimonadota bacterium]
MNPERCLVRLGEFTVRKSPAQLVTLALGSCVAVVLHDAESGVAGLAHAMLPAPGNEREPLPEGRYVVSAVPAMLREMAALGASPSRTTGRLIGGASMFAALAGQGVMQIGERNLIAARRALEEAGIPITGEATGGDYGRSLEVQLPGGTVTITSYAHDPEQL